MSAQDHIGSSCGVRHARDTLNRELRRLRVLHVAATLSTRGGGPATTLRSLLPALKSCAVDCSLATTSWWASGKDEPPVRGVPTHCFPAGWLSGIWPAHSPSLSRFLLAQVGNFDVVHVHDLWHHANYAACRAAIEQRVPCVLSVHGAVNHWLLQRKTARLKSIKKGLYMRMVQGGYIRSASAVHALTDYEAERIRLLGFATPTFVAPVGVDAELVADTSARRSFLQRYPCLAGRPVILFLGRLDPIKGLDLLVRSFVKLASRHRDAMLLVAGPDQGNTQRGMQEFLTRAGVAGRAVFTGLVEGANRSAALSLADIFVLPSYSEGFSSAVLEAMVAGLPVVISEHCHFPAVAERQAGMVIGADEEELTKALDTLLADPRLRRKMGDRARALASSQYRWSDVAANMAAQYRAIAQSSEQAEATSVGR